MTELLELVKIGMVDSIEVECPFDHESPKPPTVQNDFVGVGTTLATRMSNGHSTFLYDKYRKDQDSILNPREIVGHALYQKGVKKSRPVTLNVKKASEKKVYPHAYPVTCAAHHCIPAQESLNQSQIREYMVKEGGSERYKEGKKIKNFSDGVVWSDVGYDVNGVENGVYLPGNYAVGGGRGGMGVWDGPDGNSDDDDDEAVVTTPAGADLVTDAVDAPSNVVAMARVIEDSAPSSKQLTGSNFNCDPNSRKWNYVEQAMRLAGGQFHDRHEPYSDHVVMRLQKIYNNYVRLDDDKEISCKKCKDRAKLIKKHGTPTPYGLVARLNGISGSLRGYLSGSLWSKQLYTSRWVKAYAELKGSK